MDEVILSMLESYHPKNKSDYENALKEIIQEVALLGMWRSKFFEHALFYGGTALRILYKLDRFSEDLDFSLLEKKSEFDFAPYLKAISDELSSFGFKVEITNKKKVQQSEIESAFIKANTYMQLIKVNPPEGLLKYVQRNELLKIKVELDTDPPGGFETEVKNVLLPIPFQVKTMPLKDLFASKIHAILARDWRARVKGRDFYDLLWYIGRDIPCNLSHLSKRLVQSNHWSHENLLNRETFFGLIKDKINATDFDSASKDVAPFLKPRDQASLELWSQDYFLDIITKIKLQL